MLSEISWRQFREWMAFAELEPFDEERADMRAATIVQMVANMGRDAKKQPQPLPLAGFVLRFGDTPPMRPPEQTWQEMKALAKMAVFGRPQHATPVPKTHG